LLFLIYFESVSPPGAKVIKFADDTKIIGCDAEEVQSALWQFRDMTTVCGLKLAAHKSVVMSFCNRPHQATYSIDDEVLSCADSCKDLGTTVDSKLNFSKHCQTVANRAASLNFRILKSFSYRDPKFLFSVFKIYVRPILERDSPVWSPRYVRDILTIERPQRRFTKRLPGLQDGYTYLQRLEILGAETLLVRRVKADLILTFKIIKGMVKGLDHLVTFSDHTRTRGHPLKLVMPPFRLETRKSFFSVRVVKLWNALPDTVVSADSVVQFKRLLDGITFDDVNARYFD
jgi:hypothetical protein